ncbi:MAG: transcription termination factor NusA [Planctomycetes bacterium]|nr:transcription termination factor NusA [Planctomycetota bacterium]
MNGELLRLVDSIHRDKGIDKEVLFQGIESALLSAARKYCRKSKELEVTIDRKKGNIVAKDENGPIDPAFLGRVAAQAAKQVIIQKIKEAESDIIFTEMADKQGNIITGTVQRIEHNNIIVTFGKVEGVLMKNDQIPGENYRAGDRVKALVLNIKKDGSKVYLVLTRSHPDFIRRLFELEVPEISDKTVEIKGIVREAGFRTKLAVSSSNPKVDAVGACVGVRGRRIKNILEEVYGEKIDIIKWEESPELMIKNAMKPAEVEAVEVVPQTRKASVFVRPDQLSLAIGKKGQNIRLVCKLARWDIDVVGIGDTSATEVPAEASCEKPEGEAEAVPEGPAAAEAKPEEPVPEAPVQSDDSPKGIEETKEKPVEEKEG